MTQEDVIEQLVRTLVLIDTECLINKQTTPAFKTTLRRVVHQCLRMPREDAATAIGNRRA